MTKSNIVAATDIFYWFDQTIYLFHVPLFFICSGYLYQTYSKVNSFSLWKTNCLKKLLDLGIPFLTFATITWALKTVFSSQVNSEVGSLHYSLFVDPLPPYWFLLCLLIMFFITPTFEKTSTKVCLLAVALFFRFSIFIFASTKIPVINQLLYNYFWFILGINLTGFDLNSLFKKKYTLSAALALFLLFAGGSVLIYVQSINNEVITFVLGLMACISVIFIIGSIYSSNMQTKLFGFFAKYTMPIFLMHTIFAATLRAVLLKLSITNSAIHIVAGLIISFAGPIIAAIIMNKTIYLEFFLYPVRTIKRIKKGNIK
jgi:fucose 4-O-acetylase-like acetyltransferase